MNRKQIHIGESDGRQIYQYTFSNTKGMDVSIINYGGIIKNLIVPDKNGHCQDVVLGFDHLKQYLTKNSNYFGCIAGRYANRIALGKFELDGTIYHLAANNGPNHLHGGIKGFDKVVWNAENFLFPDSAGVVLTYFSKDGEEGYPGNLKARVIYTLNNNNELRIEYQVTTDKPTVINLTNHSYFNLLGQGNGKVYSHRLQIPADKYLPVDENRIPTGEIAPVQQSPMDFRQYEEIGRRIGQVEGGYDHTYVLNGFNGKLQRAASVYEPLSGRIMEVLTDQPGIQFYSGNFLDGSITGKGNRAYQQHDGFCLETQHFPDSPNQPSFPSTVLRPGEKYQTTTIYRFKAEG